MSSSNFSLPVRDSEFFSGAFGEAVRPEGLEKAVGYSDGFEKAVGRFSLMLFVGFVGLTLNMVSASLMEREKKIPFVSQELNDKILPNVRELGFWLGYGSVSVMFFINTMGYGMVTRRVS